MRTYVSVYECSFYRGTVADTVEATHGKAGTEIMEVYPTTNMDKGALFKWDVSIMIVVSSSAFNTLNY